MRRGDHVRFTIPARPAAGARRGEPARTLVGVVTAARGVDYPGAARVRYVDTVPWRPRPRSEWLPCGGLEVTDAPPTERPAPAWGVALGGARPAGYRAVLGVSDGASASEIRGAYRRLAKRCHPDVSPGAAARFAAIAEAYAALRR